MQKITIVQIKQKRDEIFNSGLTSQQALQQFQLWLQENESNFDEMASEAFDQQLDNFFKAAKTAVEEMEDSPEKRKGLRMIGRGNNTHISIEKMLNALEKPHPYNGEIQQEWTKYQLDLHQTIADYLFDVSQNAKSIKYSVVFLTLFYGCIDELNVAHHLGKQFYFIQANSHLRTVLETLDRIELFLKEEKWIDVWANGTWKQIQDELGPAKVRRKLGEEPYDPLYGYLSNNGTHSSFDTFKSRAWKLVQDGAPTAQIFVGGINLVHLQILHYHFSLIIGNLVLHRLVKLFPEHLHEGEIEESMKALSKRFIDFNERHLIPWAKENKLDISELENHFLNFSEYIDNHSKDK